ncbi:MAG: exo-beta-N-acetylmuramidase NamZ domain-containing protein, partial [Acidobacteriota bacterium]
MPIFTGLDRMLRSPEPLAGRRYGLLAHGASVTDDLRPAHIALAASKIGPPAVLFGPEHGYYGVEQDMVASEAQTDPMTGAQILSLYGDDEGSLVPSADAFAGLDVL